MESTDRNSAIKRHIECLCVVKRDLLLFSCPDYSWLQFAYYCILLLKFFFRTKWLSSHLVTDEGNWCCVASQEAPTTKQTPPKNKIAGWEWKLCIFCSATDAIKTNKVNRQFHTHARKYIQYRFFFFGFLSFNIRNTRLCITLNICICIIWSNLCIILQAHITNQLQLYRKKRLWNS